MSDEISKKAVEASAEQKNPSEGPDAPASAARSPSPSTSPEKLAEHTQTIGDDGQVTEEEAPQQETRAEKGPEWFGRVHPPPRAGDPNRRFLYAQNVPIPIQERESIVRRWKASMVGDGTADPSPMGEHLRPSTPPLERARKAKEQLEETGMEVNNEMYKSIFDQFTQNAGFYTALQEYVAEKKDIPVEHAQELVRQIDRLKAEFADQLGRQVAINNDLRKEFDDFKRNAGLKAESLERLNDRLEADYKFVKREMLLNDDEMDKRNIEHNKTTNQLQKQIGQLEEELEQSKSQNSSPQKETSGQDSSENHSQHSEDQAPADSSSGELIAAREKLTLVVKERNELKAFSEFFYKQLKQEKASWDVMIKAMISDEETLSKMPKESRELIAKFRENLLELEHKYLFAWPGIGKKLHDNIEVERDILTSQAFEEAKKELLKKLVDVMELNQKLQELEQQRDDHLRNIGMIQEQQKETNDKSGAEDYEKLIHEKRWQIRKEEQAISRDLQRTRTQDGVDIPSAQSSPFIWESPDHLSKLHEDHSRAETLVSEGQAPRGNASHSGDNNEETGPELDVSGPSTEHGGRIDAVPSSKEDETTPRPQPARDIREQLSPSLFSQRGHHTDASIHKEYELAKNKIRILEARLKRSEASLKSAQRQLSLPLQSGRGDERPQLKTLGDLVEGFKPETSPRKYGKSSRADKKAPEGPNPLDQLGFFHIQYMFHVRLLILESFQLGARQTTKKLIMGFDSWFHVFRPQLERMHPDVMREVSGSRLILKAYWHLWHNNSPEMARRLRNLGQDKLSEISQPYKAERYLKLSKKLDKEINAHIATSGASTNRLPNFEEFEEVDIRRWREEESERDKAQEAQGKQRE